jgi:hypothetical protein
MTETDRTALVVGQLVQTLPPQQAAAVLASVTASWARAVSRKELPPAAVVEILAGAVRRALAAQSGQRSEDDAVQSESR